MEPAPRVAARAKPGTPRTPKAGGTGAPCKPRARAPGAAAPDLLRAALICAEDGCPPETAMQACQRAEDYTDGICADCWRMYFYWLDGHCRRNPYEYGCGVD